MSYFLILVAEIGAKILIVDKIENAEALLVATKEIGLEVNADKTKYMVMSRDRNAGRGHRIVSL